LQLSAAGDNGNPEVVVDPQGPVANIFSDIGVCVVQQCAKLRQQGKEKLLLFFYLAWMSILAVPGKFLQLLVSDSYKQPENDFQNLIGIL
jgi:hypothetical protein